MHARVTHGKHGKTGHKPNQALYPDSFARTGESPKYAKTSWLRDYEHRLRTTMNPLQNLGCSQCDPSVSALQLAQSFCAATIVKL